MDKNIAKVKNELKEICSVKEFEDLLEQTMLGEEEKRILWLHYRDKKPLNVIADELGLSESSIKKKHRKMLLKLGEL